MTGEGTFAVELAALRPRLRRAALSVARNTWDADDMVQSAILTAIEKQAQYQPGNLYGWVSRIMLNGFYEERTRHRRMVEDVDGAAAAALSVPSHSAAVEARDALSRMAVLPTAHQSALTKIGLGFNYDEIAAAEGVPVGTIRSRLSRAREAFAGLVEG